MHCIYTCTYDTCQALHAVSPGAHPQKLRAHKIMNARQIQGNMAVHTQNGHIYTYVVRLADVEAVCVEHVLEEHSSVASEDLTAEEAHARERAVHPFSVLLL